jgi:uncharacterized protein (DUF983 family)
MTWEPPIWVFMVVFIPLALVVCLGMLRPLKGVLIALQHKTNAAPGQLEEP